MKNLLKKSTRRTLSSRFAGAMLFTLVASVAVSSALAQPDDDPFRGRWWTMPSMVERLGLSDKQVAAIDQIMFETQEKMIEVQAQVQRSQLRLGRLLEADTLDEAAIEAVLEQVSEAQCAVGALQIRARFEIAKQLDRSQRLQLTQRFNNRDRRRMLNRRN